ncbi:deoxyribodipyrimidine photo-lyase [Flammeovirga pectinis]|uniref:Deoxyribodipyrimidine photo-lyase n=1 Tax=Flammeovirga pectinis TaxID=2494373 RepID=A0A3Q9FLF2_9BACT|nr:deoxyribodipyrimidine photo-lyase [Flammeovirga pectinis]AZQ62811.1 deoxyribodipyrimidine photo-lyase [Flammeovirga pectinis]
MKKEVTIVWLRRDLRLTDNHALYQALKTSKNVLPLFIFDPQIVDELENRADTRVTFIHEQLTLIKNQLEGYNSSLLTYYATPQQAWEQIIKEYTINAVHTNHDYEPYAIKRDLEIKHLLSKHSIGFYTHKDQCIYEKDEVAKDDGLPYVVFTPYSRKWKAKFNNDQNVLAPFDCTYTSNYYQTEALPFISLEEMNFKTSSQNIPPLQIDQSIVSKYDTQRDYPAILGTTHLGIHLRFGTISVRSVLRQTSSLNEVFFNQIIWRDFYMQILYHFPHVVSENYNRKYDRVPWENNEHLFEAWKQGKTGYPIVDAAMHELNTTGYMHNRARMIVASFLCKHLLIDWRWGEAYFAEKLNDFDLAANNGGWQWAAGTGTDAQPYFRVFNPTSQMKKFDKDYTYIKKWIPDFDADNYIVPIVDHKEAREKAIATYKKALLVEA